MRLLKLTRLHFQLRFHGVKYGKHLRGNTCNIINKGIIEIGNNVSLNSFPDGQMYRVGLFAYFQHSTIKIGDNCRLNGTIVFCRKKVVIGNYCMFGPGVIICDNDSHNTSPDPLIRRTGKVKELPVAIDHNVWIGMHSVIMKGVRLGENSIVTPKSVVVNDALPNSIVGGNPAIFIKKIASFEDRNIS